MVHQEEYPSVLVLHVFVHYPSYDRKLLENVILHLVDPGQYHVADAIRSCKALR